MKHVPNLDSLTMKNTSEAIKYIKGQKENRVFLYLSYTFPRVPLNVS